MRHASGSSSGNLAARLTCDEDRLPMPNPRITASPSRVETPLVYIPGDRRHVGVPGLATVGTGLTFGCALIMTGPGKPPALCAAAGLRATAGNQTINTSRVACFYATLPAQFCTALDRGTVPRARGTLRGDRHDRHDRREEGLSRVRGGLCKVDANSSRRDRPGKLYQLTALGAASAGPGAALPKFSGSSWR